MDSDPTHKTTLYLPLSLHKRVMEESRRQNLTLTFVVRLALEQYLERQRRARARKSA